MRPPPAGGRARAGGVDKQSVMAQFRKHAESFFMLAAKNV